MMHKNTDSPLRRFAAWVNGDWEPERRSPLNTLEERPAAPKPAAGKPNHRHHSHLRQQFRVYVVTAVIVGLVMVAALLYTVSFLPAVGSTTAPGLNEVSQRYVEKSIAETGAVNTVAGMILDYRAFDTFGESTVLFAATMAVIFLTRSKHDKELTAKGPFAGNNPDPILQVIGKLLLPFILLFGFYVVVNGHISPGGGFSGGAILGGGMILASSLFGQARMAEKINARVTTGLSVGCLLAYATMKGYSFFTGANHVGWEIPKGTPGAIISAGFILPLNICVGIIVACTMYTFYSLFSQGEEV